MHKFQPLFIALAIYSMPWDLLKIRFTYSHQGCILHSLTDSLARSLARSLALQWKFNHSQLRLELWLLFGFANDSIFYGSRTMNNNASQPTIRSVLLPHSLQISFSLSLSRTRTPTSTLTTANTFSLLTIFWILLPNIVKLLFYHHPYTFSESVCLSVWMYECIRAKCS